jgi:hypothetical protein
VIQSVGKTDDGFQITILPIGTVPDGTEEDLSEQIILQVSSDALEGLAEDDLVPGTQVSAVTFGIATTSLPPRMTVHVLLPYSVD